MSSHDEPEAVIRSTRSRRPRRADPSAEARSVDPSGEGEIEDIRVEIEQTRTEMGGTLDALSQKLDPEVVTERVTVVAQDVTDKAIQQAKEAAQDVTDHALQEAKEAAREMTGQAKDAAWDATVGRAEQAVGATVEKAEEVVSSAGQTARGVGSTMLEMIKQNPVPAALAGLSIGWLWMNRPSGPPATSYPPYGGGRTSYPAPPPYSTGQAPYRDQGQSTVGAIADQVGETAGQAGEKVGQAVSSAGEKASEVAGGAAEKASAAVTGAGEVARDTGSNILETVKANPIPAALTGLGLAWLYMSRPSGSYARTSDRSYPGSRLYSPYAGETSYRDEGRGTVGQIADTVGETAGQAKDAVGELAGQAKDTAGDVVGGAQYRAERAGGWIQRTLETNPLMGAALAATVGGAVGLALPETRREDQLLGKARDSLLGQAQEVKQEAMEKVERVAEGAKKEAEEQGLTV
jgi:vacuolar-type H+-ATPase subunit H